MPKINKPDVIRDAIATYGINAQVDMAIEEMSELTKALCKERRAQLTRSNYAEAHANVIEEIADVAIMLKQLLIIFDKDDEIQKEVDYKIDRLEQRLQKVHKSERKGALESEPREQIEEMYNSLCVAYACARQYDSHLRSETVEDMGERLIQDGYLKQTEGEWIASDIPCEKYVCSVCGGACWYYDFQGEVAKSRYCPNCGAKMKGEG